MKNLQDIIPDREIVKMKNIDFWGIEYYSWRVAHPVYSDQVEELLENGYMVSTDYDGNFMVNKQLHPSPTDIQLNKRIWRNLSETIQKAGEK